MRAIIKLDAVWFIPHFSADNHANVWGKPGKRVQRSGTYLIRGDMRACELNFIRIGALVKTPSRLSSVQLVVKNP